MKPQKRELEEQGVIVSPTEPTNNRRKIWFQKGKNLLDFNSSMRTFIDGNIVEQTSNAITFKGSSGKTYQEIVYRYELIAGTYSFQKKWELISGDNNSALGRATIVNADRSTYTEYLNLNKDVESGTFTITKDAIVDIYLYINLSTALTQETQIKFYDVQLEQGSTATNFEPYIEEKIYIKNDNDVYEEFRKQQETNIATGVEFETNYTRNGKRVYGKLISISVLPNSTSLRIYHNIKSLDEIVHFIGIGKSNHGARFEFNWVNVNAPDNKVLYCNLQVTNLEVVIYSNYDVSPYSAEVTIYYTKN